MCQYKSNCVILRLNLCFSWAANFEIATFYNKFNSKLSIQFYKVFIKVNRSCDQVSRLSKLVTREGNQLYIHTQKNELSLTFFEA